MDYNTLYTPSKGESHLPRKTKLNVTTLDTANGLILHSFENEGVAFPKESTRNTGEELITLYAKDGRGKWIPSKYL